MQLSIFLSRAPMEALTNTSSAAYLTPKASNSAIKISSFLRNQNPYMKFANGYFPISLSRPFTTQKLCAGHRDSVIVGAKKNHKNKKPDTHSFVPKPEEANEFFPEAVLLKEVLFTQNPVFILFFYLFFIFKFTSPECYIEKNSSFSLV